MSTPGAGGPCSGLRTEGPHAQTVDLEAGSPAGPHPLNRETLSQAGDVALGDPRCYTALWPPSSALWTSGPGPWPICGVRTLWGRVKGHTLPSGHLSPVVPGLQGAVRPGLSLPQDPFRGRSLWAMSLISRLFPQMHFISCFLCPSSQLRAGAGGRLMVPRSCPPGHLPGDPGEQRRQSQCPFAASSKGLSVIASTGMTQGPLGWHGGHPPTASLQASGEQVPEASPPP